MERWMDGEKDGWMDGEKDGWMERWMDGEKDGWRDGWMERRMDGDINIGLSLQLVDLLMFTHSFNIMHSHNLYANVFL